MSASQQIQCWSCKKTIEASVSLSFRASCNKCSADLHACKQCKFYDTSAYNECRESKAERVLDKDKFNYCEEYAARSESAGVSNGLSEADRAKAALEALFKKKS